MIYQIQDIERDVRIALDENDVSTQLVQMGDVDTLALNDIIRSKIVEAVRRVELAAPAHLLEEGHDFSSGIYWNGDGSGFIILPDDFCRLVSFKMSDWKRTVHTAISSDDPQYELQSSEFGGIRGNVDKPVVAIVMRSLGLTLEFYSCESEEAIVSESDYLPEPKIADGCIDISEKCYKACIYHIAALVLLTIGNEKLAETLEQVSKSMIS